jgi:phage shock protein A
MDCDDALDTLDRCYHSPLLTVVRAELERLREERDADRQREYGYSQQTMNALTKERDALAADLAAARALLNALLPGYCTSTAISDDSGHGCA